MKTDTPRPIRLRDYRPPAYLIDHVDLDVSLHPREARVKARLAVRPNPNADGLAGGPSKRKPTGKTAAHKPPPLRLDGENFKLDCLQLDGTPLDARAFIISDHHLEIKAPPQRPFRLDITTVLDPESNKALQGLYRSRGIYCTQCEAQGFRRITYFLDRPDVLATYTCRVEADIREAPVLLANGNRHERGTLDGGRRHYAVWKDPHPKPCYLFALVGGDLAAVTSTFKTASGRTVDLAIYVEHGKEPRAHWAMDCLKRAMRWDEKRFGREYDLDVFNIVAVSDFNMGAMENKGLNVFNDHLVLASPETATDTDFEHIESVVAHEYFHNWTGNRITCRDWFQLCLKEGLTVFRDQEFSGDERDPIVQRISDVRGLKALQFPEDAGPLAHPVRPDTYIEINNFYTPTVYEKGAELVRMLQTLLGAERFRAGMDLYFERHDGDAATIEDFLACFADAAQVDLAHFKLWYSQSGTPELVCTLKYDTGKKTAELTVEQMVAPTARQPKKRPLVVPMKLALLGSNGREIELKLDGGNVPGSLIEITKRRQTFRFTGVPSAPVPSLLRGFSAPVNLTIDLSDRNLEFLMEHDGDLFNRWQAANRYATRTLLQSVARHSGGKRTSRAENFAKALGAALAYGRLPPAYRAELLRLPTQSDIARELKSNVDPDIVLKAHRQLLKLVGTTLGDTLEEIYSEMAPRGPFSPDAKSAGRRALRNAALTLLTARGETGDLDRLYAHFYKASNMTDEAHALYLIAAQAGPERDKALRHFYDRWHGDHLVIDTWFAAEAQSPAASALARVRALTKHPDFSLTAPNKVRALIGRFAMQNHAQFNRRDGAGYTFVADQVLAIDSFNPQIAARMLGSFRSWRALEPKRRELAQAALTRIAGTSTLSRDVREIVTRMLEA
ncbi:MAG: aminopeptidase N [Hyphomicrobium sp.]